MFELHYSVDLNKLNDDDDDDDDWPKILTSLKFITGIHNGKLDDLLWQEVCLCQKGGFFEQAILDHISSHCDRDL